MSDWVLNASLEILQKNMVLKLSCVMFPCVELLVLQNTLKKLFWKNFHLKRSFKGLNEHFFNRK